MSQGCLLFDSSSLSRRLSISKSPSLRALISIRLRKLECFIAVSCLTCSSLIASASRFSAVGDSFLSVSRASVIFGSSESIFNRSRIFLISKFLTVCHPYVSQSYIAVIIKVLFERFLTLMEAQQ